jgi:hypothetical protein
MSFKLIKFSLSFFEKYLSLKASGTFGYNLWIGKKCPILGE